MIKFNKVMVISGLLTIASIANVFASVTSSNDEITQYDTNHDGKVSVLEAMAKGMSIKTFEVADVNHDGYLNLAELGSAFVVQHGVQVGVMDDHMLTLKVKSALAQNTLVKNLNVQVETENGVVQLSGLIPHRDSLATAQIMTAGQIAAGINGVQHVVNNLTTAS